MEEECERQGVLVRFEGETPNFGRPPSLTVIGLAPAQPAQQPSQVLAKTYAGHNWRRSNRTLLSR